MANDIFYYPSAAEDRYFHKLQELADKWPHEIRRYLNCFPVYASRRSFLRQLAHYELFKITIDLPGHYADFGIYFGNSFFSWHKFLEAFLPTATHKKVVGFDTFSGFPDIASEDGQTSADVQKEAGGFSSASFLEEFEALLSLHNEDGVIPSNRGSFVIGDVTKTLPVYLERNPEIRFCLLNLDMDLYEPTYLILEQCWDRLVKGGVVVLDEYATSKWPGETRAWDDFVRKNNINTVLRRFSWTNAPSAYLVKE